MCGKWQSNERVLNVIKNNPSYFDMYGLKNKYWMILWFKLGQAAWAKEV